MATVGWITGAYAVFRDLMNGVAYRAYVKARNGDGVETVWTLIGQGVPSGNGGGTDGGGSGSVHVPVAGAVTADRITYTTTWSANGNPAGTEYYVELRNAAGQVVAAQGWITGLTHTFTGLNPNTPYRAYVKARYAGVESGWTALAQRHTLADLPQPGAVTFSNGQVTATWSPGANPWGTAYQVEILTADGQPVDASSWQIGTTATFGDLAPGTYRVRVKARNGDGIETDWADVGQVTVP